MPVSSTFARHELALAEESGVSEKPEEWEMSDNVMTHLFAQMRHIEARMTAKSTMSEVSALVVSRAKMLNFQVALGCAAMVEWCYLRQEAAKGDMSESSYYERLGAAWDDKYEAARKFYNAPNEVFLAELDKISLPSE